MNKLIGTSIVLFLIILYSQPIGGHSDHTQVGVSNGDGFTFFLEDYTYTENGETTHELSLGFDDFSYDEIFVSEGQEFQMTVGDATPVVDEEDDEATLLVVFETPSGTAQTHESLDGSFIGSTDWDNVKEEFEIAKTMIRELDPDAIFTLVDTSSVFGIDVDYSYIQTDEFYNSTASAKGEVRFNKDDGVMNSFDLTTSFTNDFIDDTHDSFERIKMNRVSESNSESPLLPLPGFELYFGLIGLIIPIFFRKRK